VTADNAEFVGRDAELRLIERVADRPSVIHVYGPTGIGKSALLAHAASQRSTNEPSLIVADDVQDMTPKALRSALAEAKLQGGVLLTASTTRLPVDWDGAADRPTPQLALKPLTASEVAEYARWCDLGDDAEELFALSQGHPMAMVAFAEALSQSPQRPLNPGLATELLRGVGTNVCPRSGDAAQSTAMTVCALARTTTQELLGDISGIPEPAATFDWLAGQSWVEQKSRGISPAEIARQALLADARWRAPDATRELEQEVLRAHHQRLLTSRGRVEHLADLLFLGRHRLKNCPLLDADAELHAVGRPTPDDASAIVDLARRQGGDPSASIARAWFDARPDAFVIARGADPDRIVGFILNPYLGHRELEVPPVEDAALTIVREVVEQFGALRDGERVSVMRMCADGAGVAGMTPLLSTLHATRIAVCMAEPRVALTVLITSNPEIWAVHRRAGLFDGWRGGPVSLNDTEYRVYVRDRRRLPDAHWLERLLDPVVNAPLTEPQVLGREAFDHAVHDALKSFESAAELRDSPLLESRLIRERTPTAAGVSTRLEELRHLIRATIDALRASSRTVKFYEALRYTYLDPVETQQVAAEVLDLPFSTYRRHLVRGVQLVADELWRGELGEDLGWQLS